MSKARILVVDDEDDIVCAVSMRLQAAGYDTIIAKDGRLATRLAYDAAPDLVILDIGLPFADGHTVAELMLASVDAKCTPILFLTARDSVDDRLKASRAGICRYLTKPFRTEELLETVDRALNCTRRPPVHSQASVEALPAGDDLRALERVQPAHRRVSGNTGSVERAIQVCNRISKEARMDMGKQTVLVVEDEQEMLRAVTLRLQSAGYAVISATTGEMATNLAESEWPDIVLLDVGMPGCDGHTVARRLRKNANNSPVPIVFLTARTSQEDRARAAEVGAFQYLTKPFKSVELLDTIARALIR